MLDGLDKHHIGIVIDLEKKKELESRWNVSFHKDELQGVQVLFVKDEELGIYREYITNEGRAKNYNLGLHHICYNAKDNDHFKDIHTYLCSERRGVRLTFPEKSGSEECNYVAFYLLRGFGVVEINILDYEAPS
tara:strand:- start:1251 stop:1652 length:402 start_codon:yes stop_codon:yes gene_type:complete